MGIILLTNDDGVHAKGLNTLYKVISETEGLGKAYIVAPDRERSASGRSITIHKPLKVVELSENIYSITGTPTDSVVIGLSKVLPEIPKLVISGINHGPNLGDDIFYSGTVSAAMEGTLYDVPSIAMSLNMHNGEKPFFETAARVAAEIAAFVLQNPLPYDTLLNVNVPNTKYREIKGWKFTRQGKRRYEGAIHDTKSPWGDRYYWIGGGTATWDKEEDNDINAVNDGYVSITPLHLDLTNHNSYEFLSGQWGKWSSKKKDS
jgi:5'-nucleotidase